jgi:hypothetical protein
MTKNKKSYNTSVQKKTIDTNKERKKRKRKKEE